MNILPVIFGLLTTIIVLFALICDVTEPGWPEQDEIRRSFRTQPKSEKNAHSFDKDINTATGSNEMDPLFPGGTAENLFWFVQLSDTHFSIFKDKRRGSDLINFCDKQLSILQPRFVLLSGDLVDAKSMDTFGSKQYREEWQMYKQVTDTCTKYVDGQWYETRGNHDVFDVPNFISSKNFYRQYSVQSKFRNQTSYMFDFKTDFGRYSFIAVDACPVPGPRRPFNFFGQLKEDNAKLLLEFSRRSHGSNLTIWFGHYPTSFIVYPNNIRSIMSDGIAYLCGHLHTLGGLVEKMYTRQKTGMLELELGDWRDNRMFRVLAIDHDLLSFTDEVIEQWPIIIITNPKNAQMLAPRHEPLHRIGMSTHIRILVFNPVALKYVNVSIDREFIGSARLVKNNLYVLTWEANKYSTGLHEIIVTVEDIEGNSRTVSQPFSINYLQPKFTLIARLLLMMNLFDVGKILFWSLFSVWLAVLFLLRRCSNIRPYLLVSNVPILTAICRWCNLMLRALWKFTHVDKLFYITVAMFVYVGVGPWFIGEFLESEIGIMFVWGVVVLNTLIPGSFTYYFGIFQIFTFNIPLTCYLGYYYDRVNYKYRCWQQQESTEQHQQQNSFQPPIWWIFVMEIPLIILFLLQFYLALSGFPKAYGIVAFCLSPVRTWSAFSVFPLNLIAYRQACSKNAAIISLNLR